MCVYTIKLNFVTWDDWHDKSVYTICVYNNGTFLLFLDNVFTFQALGWIGKSHRNELTKKFETSQVISRYANSVWPWQWNDSNVRFISYRCCNPEAIEVPHVLYFERLTSLRVEGQREKHDKAWSLFVNGSPKQQALYSQTLSLDITSLGPKAWLRQAKLLSVGGRRTLASGYA